MGSFDWSSLLPLITAVSIVLTVIVGIIGLRQGHYYKGRITPRGRRAVAVMVALGFVTLLSGIADRRISDMKETQEANLRSRQFASQMSSLQVMQQTLADSIHRQQRLTNDLRRVQGTLNLSLDRQERLAASTAENLRMGRLLQEQGKRNTADVLQRVFDEANRITLDQVSADFHIICGALEPPDAPRVRPLPDSIEIKLDGPRGRVRLFSRNRETSRQFFLGTKFVGFSGPLRDYDTFSAWREARATIILTAVTPGRRMLEDLPNSQAIRENFQAIDEQFRRDESLPDFTACAVYAYVRVNGRVLVGGIGRLGKVNGGRYEMRLEARVNPDELPQPYF